VSEYLVIYEQAGDGGWGAHLPDLPGVVALGKTREEVKVRIQEAVLTYAECMSDEQRQLPRPVHESGTVTV